MFVCGVSVATKTSCAAEDFAQGRDTPGERIKRRLAAIARLEPDVRAFVLQVPAEMVLAAAADADRRWKAGTPLSPLDGATVVVKDIIETKDMATGQGSPIWTGFQSGRDAATVAALRAAGLIVLGKTTTTEFAATHVNHATTNPHDISRTPGGSSSGSAAAVAAGMADLALGSQVVGSTLRPASYCGCIGFKTTIGALNRGGSYDPFSQSCVGLFANSLSDLWIAGRLIARHAGGDPGHAPLAGPNELPPKVPARRLAVLRPVAWQSVGRNARLAFERWVDSLVAAGIACTASSDHAALAQAEAALPESLDLTKRICAWESLWPLGAYERAHTGGLSPAMINRLAEARGAGPERYQADLARREEIRVEYALLSVDFDAVITLSATGAAPMGLANTGDPGLNVPASLLGCPAVSLPLLEDDGLPLGVQIMGWQGRDADLISVAQSFLPVDRGRTDPGQKQNAG